MENTQVQEEMPTIKDQLMTRFAAAREVVGRHWKNELAAAEPYFNTKKGLEDMLLVTQAINNRRRGQVDRIRPIVLGLEKLAGIPHVPII